MNLAQIIYSDYKKHSNYGGSFLAILFLTKGFSASCQYSIGHYLYKNFKIFGLRIIILSLCSLWQKWIEFSCGISIPASATIGHSFYIGQFGVKIINSSSIIGNNYNISQGVTIGVSGLNKKSGVPVIGNNVYIGANSIIAGKITICNNVLIGACSLINQSFAENSVVLGVPEIKISKNSSNVYI